MNHHSTHEQLLCLFLLRTVSGTYVNSHITRPRDLAVITFLDLTSANESCLRASLAQFLKHHDSIVAMSHCIHIAMPFDFRKPSCV